MKVQILCLVYVFVSFNSEAGVSRAPAVIAEQCDVDVPTTMIDEKSAKEFTGTINHEVIIHSENKVGCSKNSKRYADSVYEENVKNEINILLQKNTICSEYFGKQNLKSYNYVCESPVIVSKIYSKYGCHKNIEVETHKVSFVDTVNVEIKYKQVGKKFIEKPIEVVQKELCTRTKKCLEQATDENDKTAYKKLADVSCKSDLVPVNTARVPALQQDPSLNNGERISEPKLELIKENHPEGSGAVAK